MSNNFLITGFGRSGTMFLSQVMNMSEQWTVEHEPRGGTDEDILSDEALKGFESDHYGEVNSRLRRYLLDIPADKKGIIFREPRDIIKSTANRKDIKKTIEVVEDVMECYRLFTYWVKHFDVVSIEFDRMTSDHIYLRKTLLYFGVKDVDVNKVDLNVKVNANKDERYKSFDELPNEIKSRYFSLL